VSVDGFRLRGGPEAACQVENPFRSSLASVLIPEAADKSRNRQFFSQYLNFPLPFCINHGCPGIKKNHYWFNHI
jgi:hypothetical protein